MQLNSRTEKMPLCSPLENGGGPETGDQIIKYQIIMRLLGYGKCD
jgi:hypothetical protein